MPEPSEQLIAQAAALWSRAQSVVVLTGAGLSTGSGIPDFRSPRAGLWMGVDPMAVASQETFRYAPETFFAWVRPLASQIRQAEPNAAHQALAQIETQGKLHTVITQNIDDLHRRAGSRNVLEIHGSLRTVTCVRCFQVRPAGDVLDRFLTDGILPRCAGCGGLLKPDVTLMGEELSAPILRLARQTARECDLMLVAGSSLEVMPAASLPLEALQHDAPLIIVNREPTYVDARATVVIRDDVNTVLPRLADAIGVPHGAR